MENNEEEKIIEQYIQQREKETQEEEANEELLQKRMYIKRHIVKLVLSRKLRNFGRIRTVLHQVHQGTQRRRN